MRYFRSGIPLSLVIYNVADLCWHFYFRHDRSITSACALLGAFSIRSLLVVLIGLDGYLRPWRHGADTAQVSSRDVHQIRNFKLAAKALVIATIISLGSKVFL